MRKIIFAAAVVNALTAGVHIFMGGADVVAPLFDSNLQRIPLLTLYAVWHMVSAILVLSAIALFLLSYRKKSLEKGLLFFLGVTYSVFGLVFLVVCFVNFDGSLFLELPQWMLLLPVGVLTLLSALKESEQTEPEQTH